MKYKIEYQNLNRLAYPVLLNYLLDAVFSLLDKAIVGHYSIEGFAVVGVAANMIDAITGALGVLSVAFNIAAVREAGQNREEQFEKTFAVSKTLVLLSGLGFFVLSLLGGRAFFRSCFGISGQPLEELLSYFYPASVTVIQNLFLFQYSAYYRNRLNTRISLLSTAVSLSINLFFDYGLVYGAFGLPQLGTAGVAWGSVIGLGCGLLVYRLPYWKRRGMTGLFAFDKAIAVGMVRLIPSLFGQELLESTILAVAVTGAVARQGAASMAAYNLLETVASMVGLPVYAYATASQTYALQKRAAGDEKAVRRYLRCGVRLAFLVVAGLCCFSAAFWSEIFRWIVTDRETIAFAGSLLPVALAVPLARVSYQVYMMYLQGAGKDKDVFICTSAATVLVSALVLPTARFFGLGGIYCVLTGQYLVLARFYQRKQEDDHESKGI